MILVVIACVGAAYVVLSSSAKIHPNFTPGHQALYRFGYRGEGVYQLAALFSRSGANKPPQHLYTAVAGTLVETVVDRDAQGATIMWNIADPQVRYSTGAPVDPIYAAQLRNDLELPCATRVDNDGRVTLIAASPDASQLGVQFMRGALGTIQLVTPATRVLAQRIWTVTEPDADGPRTSTYTLERWISDPFGNATVAFTRATSLTVTHRVTSPFHRPDVLGAGADRGVWRLDGMLESLTSADARNTYYGQTLIARSQSALGIVLTAQATLDDKKLVAARAFAMRRLASTSATPLHVEPSEADVARIAFTNVLGTDDEQSLSARLVDATKRHDEAGNATLAQKFAALFYFHASAVADFKPVLRRARSDSIPFEVLSSAFQQAGTAPAQSALAEIAELRGTELHAGETLAIGLGLLAHPMARVDAALEYVGDHGEPNAAASAELALGSVAGTLAGTDDARASAILDRIERRLSTAPDDDWRRTELLALGNARAASSVNAILSLRDSGSSDVRSAVATALRGIDDPEADDALRTLLGDKEPDVRLAAATAFESRTPSSESFDALVAAMQHDSSADVRAQAVSAVWSARTAFPRADAAVHGAARDPSQSVRSAVQVALAAPATGEQRPVPPDLGALGSR